MHAEEEDVPEYLRTKKPGPSRALAIVAIGSVITGVLMLIFAKPVVIDVAQLKQGIRVGGQPVFSEQPAKTYSEPLQPVQEPPGPFEPAQQVARPSPTQADIEWSEQQAALAEKRMQNSFNDNNYTPKRSINTMPATPVTREPVARQKRQQEIVVVGKETRLRDYCPYAQGSIEHRNCKMRVDLDSRNR